ncbi:MAG: hypothetical protein PHI63_03675 [Patescibacteria group bacterium]|nr:hypothetical protein [Patescibacteria group bacterium]
MGSGAKIALVALLVLMVVAVARFVQNQGDDEKGAPMRSKPVKASLMIADRPSSPAAMAEAPASADPRPIIRCYTPEELAQEGTADLLVCEGLEITGLTGIVRDGNTVEVLVSLRKVGTGRRP